MGKSIPVIIGQKKFSSKTEAKKYFMDQCESVRAGGQLQDGFFFDELKELYIQYCKVTKWDLSNKVIYAFSVDYEPRKNNQTWSTYLCYWVHFSPKSKLAFSVKVAVDEIAKALVVDQQSSF
ncbi:hypothetical protein AB7254_16965 [Providencia rettgeri]